MRRLVQSLPTEPSGHSSERVTSGRGTCGRGTLGRGSLAKGTSGGGTSGRGTLVRLSPPADSSSSCCSTSTSDEFPAASAFRCVGFAGRGIGGVRCPKKCSLMSVWVSGVCGRGRCPGVQGHGAGPGAFGRGAGAGGSGRGVCTCISWPCSGSKIG